MLQSRITVIADTFKHVRRLFDAQAAEESQLYHSRFSRIELGERGQGIVQSHQIFAGGLVEGGSIVE